jgi:hypothetical protein
MSKFTIEEVTRHNDWVSVFLIGVMTDNTGEGEDFLAKFKIEHGGQDRVLDVQVTVNGVEVDFMDFLKRIESSYEERVSRRAIELLKEKCGAVTDALYALTEHVERVGSDTFGFVDRDGGYTPELRSDKVR